MIYMTNFVESNIPAYDFDNTFPVKQEKARQILQTEFVIST